MADFTFTDTSANDLFEAYSGIVSLNPLEATLAETIEGAFGILEVFSDGSYTFTPDNAAINALKDEETPQDIFTVIILNEGGESIGSTNVSVDVFGANDDAILGGDNSGSVTEDGSLTASGTVTVTDVDSPQELQPDTQIGSFGTLVVSATGWTYTLNNGAAQSLGSGESEADFFSLTSADGSADFQVIIDINGTNDAPVITSTTQSATLAETNAALSTSGAVLATDIDATDGLSFTLGGFTLGSNRNDLTETQQDALFEAFSLGSTTSGSWAYNLASPDFLNDSDTVTLTYRVNVSDGNGGNTFQNVVITITGRDEIFVGGAGNDSFEGTAFDDQINGGAGFDTLDLSEVSGPVSIDFSEGSIVTGNGGVDTVENIENFILTGGADTFIGGNAGETVTGGEGDDDIETNGGNDIVFAGGGNDLVHGGSGAGDDYYDGGAGTGDTLTYSSTTTGVVVDMNAIDRSANATVAAILAGVPLPTTTAAGLATGAEIGTDAFRNFENVTGGSGNDTLRGDSGANILNGGDGNDLLEGRGGADTLTGGAGIDTITYANQTTAVQVNLNDGTVNAGLQGGFDTLSGIENAILSSANDQFIGDGNANEVTGGLGNDQLDGGAGIDTAIFANSVAVDGLAVEVDVPGLHALVLGTLSGDGQDTIQNFEQLVFGGGTLSTADDVTIQIVDANAVVASVADVNALNESELTGSPSTTMGNVLTNDINLDAAVDDVKIVTGFSSGFSETSAVAGGTLTGQWGTLTLNANGGYTYTANASTNALGAGDTYTDTFRYQADDGDSGTSESETLTITINGVDDAAVITGNRTSSVTEDLMVSESGTISTTGTLTAVDPDTGESGFTASTSTRDTGTFAINAAGVWTFTANNSATIIQQIGAGASLTETFDVETIGGNATSVIVTINGVNDNPVAGAVSFGESGSSFEETNAALSTSGVVAFADIDTNDTPQAAYTAATGLSASVANGAQLTVSQAAALSTAFSINPAGAFAFTTPSPDYLGADDVLTLTYTVDITDDHGGSTTRNVVITINGNNDQPVITSAAQTATLEESAEPAQTALTASGAVTASDVDNGDILSFSLGEGSGSVSATGTVLTVAQQNTLRAGFTLNANGTWSYSVASPDFLGDDDVVTLTNTVEVRDGNGGLTSQNVTITINGTNDAPDILAPGNLVHSGADNNGTIATATSLSGLFALNADPEVANSATVPHVSIAGTGGNHVDIYSFVVTSAGTIGTFDTDHVVGFNGSFGSGDSFLRLLNSSGTVIASNDDNSGDPGSESDSNQFNSSLTFTFTTPGTYYIEVAEFSRNPIDTGDTYELQVSLTAPGQLNSYTPALTETNLPLSTSGKVNFTDVDNGDTAEASYTAATDATVTATGITLTAPQIAAITAGFTLVDGAGNYTYSLASPDYLAAGDVVTAVFNVHVIDDLGADTVQPITVTITGTNDAPVLSDFATTLSDTSAFDLLSIPSSAGLTIAVLASDVDTGDTRTFALVSVAEEMEMATVNFSESGPSTTSILTDYGLVTIAADGTVSFLANDVAINALNALVSVTRTFTVRVTDNNGASDDATFTITINGANDNPIVPTPLVFNARNDNAGVVTLNLLTGEMGTADDAFDPDAGGSVAVDGMGFTVSVASTALTMSEISSINAALSGISPNTMPNGGGYTFDTALFDTLDLGETATITFTYSVSDGDGNSLPRTATVVINGALEVAIGLTENDDGPYQGGNFGDLIDGLDGDDVLNGNAGNDNINGGAGDDRVSGGSGDDVLFGGTGDDNVSGGSGVDTISGGDGTDTISGGSEDDIISGGAGADRLDGGAGFDTATYASATAGVALNLTTGIATGGDANGDTFISIESLVGSAFADTITGSAGDDRIEGGAGDDILNGGAGIDTISYASSPFGVTVHLDNPTPQDTVQQGIDTISGFENILGSSQADSLWGDAGNNVINGGAGFDFIVGGGGTNTLIGGADGDVYIVQGLNDNVIEAVGGGFDVVLAQTNFTLAAGSEVEALAVSNASGIILIGNELQQTLTGDAGNDTLNAGGGNDLIISGLGTNILVGGAGSDIYFAQGLNDVVTEDAGGGFDVVLAGGNLTLAAGSEVEVIAVNTASGVTITGSNTNQVIQGGAGGDRLVGGLGNDTLTGSGGADTFVLLNTFADRDFVTDFTSGTDKLEISAALFGGGLLAGSLSADQFLSGAGVTAATTADQRFIYNSSTGNLLFDADGNGAGTAVLFANLSSLPALTAADFLIAV